MPLHPKQEDFVQALEVLEVELEVMFHGVAKKYWVWDNLGAHGAAND